MDSLYFMIGNCLLVMGGKADCTAKKVVRVSAVHVTIVCSNGTNWHVASFIIFMVVIFWFRCAVNAAGRFRRDFRAMKSYNDVYFCSRVHDWICPIDVSYLLSSP